MGEARLSTEWIRTPIITAAAVLGLFLCYLLTLPFLSSLTWAFVLSVVFLPMHRRIEGLTRQYNSLAAAVSVSMAMIVVLVPLALVGQQIVREAANGSVHLAGVLRTAEWREAIAAYPRLAEIVVWIEKQLDLAEVVSNLAAWLSSLSTSLLRGSVSQGINFVLTYYLLFYFLRDRDRAFLVIRSLSPLNPTEAKEVARRVVDTVQATVFGTLAVAAIQGTLGGLMFWWLALPTPVFWGVVMGLLAIVPVLGGFDAAKLAFFLLDPHPKMPNMQLTRSEAADIAAYISTLRSGRTR